MKTKKQYQSINPFKVMTVSKFIRENFEYIHNETIKCVCKAFGFSKIENMAVYSEVNYMIDYTTR